MKNIFEVFLSNILKKYANKTVFIMLAFAIPLAHAQTADVSIVNIVTQSISAAASSKIMTQAISWLGSFMLLQMLITNINLIKSGADIQAAWGKFLGSLVWFGFCVIALTRGPAFIDAVGNQIFTNFAPNLPSPGSIITSTLALCTTLLIAIVAVGTSIAGVGNSSLGNVLVVLMFGVFGVGMYLAIKIMMIQIELALTVMLAPLSFSFLPMLSLKDQGIAPFKSLISLIYRIIVLGIVYAAFSEVVSVAGDQINGLKWTNPFTWATAIQTIFSALAAYPLIAFMIYKSDAIAAGLSSGSTSLGPADVASAAAAGAAAGAAIASGGAAAGAGVAKGGESMGNFMKGLHQSGSVSNASPYGIKPESLGQAPQRPPTMSTSSAYPTNSAGAPMLPGEADGGGAGSSAPTRTEASSVSDLAPARPAYEAETPVSGKDVGSDQNAGIGGAGDSTGDKLDKLIDAMGKDKKPTFGDHASRLSQNLQQEKTATHVSINTNHHD